MSEKPPGSPDPIALGLDAGRRCHEAARDYLGLGWSVLALCPPDHVGVGAAHGKTCSSPGKAPLPRWKEYQGRTATPDEVNQWWRQWPNANVGCAMGPVSGLVGVDVEGPAGEARLAELAAGDLPPTLEFLTSKGRRLLYAIPPGAVLRTTFEALEVCEEVRLQGEGSQTVMPPSRHPDGGEYAWLPGRGPGEIAAAPAPAWIVKAMSRDGTSRPGGVVEPLQDGECIDEGRRDSVLTSMAGTMRRRGFSHAAILAALQVENEGRCLPELPAEQVEKIARSVARYSPDAFAGVSIHWPTAPPGSRPPETDGLDCESLFGLESVPVRWLVPGLLPLGKLVIIAGDGGHGKSTLTLALAAALSRGKPAFGLDYQPCEPSDTLIASCEDDYADTVVPRLLSHGADLHRIHRIKGVRSKDGGKSGDFTLACVDAIAVELARRPTVRLIVIDPAGAYIGRTGIDDHKDSELRALLSPLSELAAATGVLILLVKHLNKGATAKAVQRVGGSVGYVNSTRATFVACPSAEDPDTKLFLPMKFNLGPVPAGLSYRLEALPMLERSLVLDKMPHLQGEDRRLMGEQLYRVEWKGEVQTSADEALAPPSKNGKGEGTKVERCCAWIKGLLESAPAFYPSDMLEAGAKKIGIGRSTYDTARSKLKDDWVTRATLVNGRWYVGPRDLEFAHVDENRLSGCLDSWSLGFLEAQEPGEPKNPQGTEKPNLVVHTPDVEAF